MYEEQPPERVRESREPKESKGLSVPMAILLAGMLIAGSYYLVNRSHSTASKDLAAAVAASQSTKLTVDPVTEKDHLLGNPQAKIVIVEYSDLECPYCKTFNKTMLQLMDQYGRDGSVAWVYRHFPIDDSHKKARKEAEASECAAELGGNQAFWDFIGNIYDITPSNDGLDPELLSATAMKIGLDKKSFDDCLASGKYAKKIESQYQSGLRIGISGTPNSFIISKGNDIIPIEGAQSFISVKAIIDTILSAAK